MRVIERFLSYLGLITKSHLHQELVTLEVSLLKEISALILELNRSEVKTPDQMQPLKSTRQSWPRLKKSLEERDARELYWSQRGGEPLKEK